MLVSAVEDGSRQAVRLLLEMAAVVTVPDLTRLAKRGERTATSGIADDVVWSDERLQRDLRAAVAGN